MKGKVESVKTVKGFAMFLNLSEFDSVGFFDENFFFFLEEIDLCKRLIKAKIKEFTIVQVYQYFTKVATLMMVHLIMKWNYQETGIGCGQLFITIKSIMDF